MAKFYRSEDRTVLFELFGAGTSVENLKNLKANTTDAAVEKHVPVVTQDGNKVSVAVSSVEHPMLPEHYIMGVYIETKNGGQLHRFQPGDTPKATAVTKDIGANYEIAYEVGKTSSMLYGTRMNTIILMNSSWTGLLRLRKGNPIDIQFC